MKLCFRKLTINCYINFKFMLIHIKMDFLLQQNMQSMFGVLIFYFFSHRIDKVEDRLGSKPDSLNGGQVSSPADFKHLSGNNGKHTDRPTNIVHSSSSSWNGDANSSTVNDLLKMSHQGFGNDRGEFIIKNIVCWILILLLVVTCCIFNIIYISVASWNGDQSQVERTVEEERQASWKRSRDEYEMDLDRGRVSRKPFFSSLRENLFDSSENNKYK